MKNEITPANNRHGDLPDPLIGWGADAAPVSSGEFEHLMAALGPFESSPRLAVAVSGGGDSMALVQLTNQWARSLGGRITALSVDHGLRPAATAEVRQVATWMAAQQIEHHILTWRDGASGSGSQAAARDARYRLLCDWAAGNGVLHLCLAHHLDDQDETVLMRLARGSRIDGLAAMAPIAERASCRLLRPLLGVRADRLRATLRQGGRQGGGQSGQSWIDDPSNNNPDFLRPRLRALMPELLKSGLSTNLLNTIAGRAGAARVMLDEQTAALLADACTLHPAGFAWIDRHSFVEAEDEILRRALARVLMCVGGRRYQPRRDRLEALVEDVFFSRGTVARSLAGCVCEPRDDRILVWRENRKKANEGVSEPSVRVVAGDNLVWEGRFLVSFCAARPVGDGKKPDQHPVWLAPLGDDGWAEIAEYCRKSPDFGIPARVRPGLPALRDKQGVFAVPHMKYKRVGSGQTGARFDQVVFSPQISLSGVGFQVAPHD